MPARVVSLCVHVWLWRAPPPGQGVGSGPVKSLWSHAHTCQAHLLSPEPTRRGRGRNPKDNKEKKVSKEKKDSKDYKKDSKEKKDSKDDKKDSNEKKGKKRDPSPTKPAKAARKSRKA